MPKKILAKYVDNKDVVQHATGKNGMVSASHPEASKAGTEMLRKGGNAVDAAAAVVFALNVAEPMMSGIGGSGFMMVHSGDTGKTVVVNGHTKAPKAAHPKLFFDENDEIIPFPKRSTSGDAIGVPGTLMSVAKALEEYGTMSLADVLEPAIKLAEEGVEVNWVLAHHIELFKERMSDETKELFFPNGKPLQKGDLLVQKELAKTFKLIQKKGPDVFYKGEIADAIVNHVQKWGGKLEKEDLEEYEATIDEPVWGEFMDHQMASCPPPSSGGITTLQILEMLERLNIENYKVDSPEKYYYLSEAMRLAFADRAAYMGDPDFNDMPINGMRSPEYIAERIKLIDPEKKNPNIEFGNPWAYQEGGGGRVNEKKFERPIGQTTHYAVADNYGNVVSHTLTLEHPFGSGFLVPEYGLMLNNEVTDFDPEPGGPNEIEGGKRPLSSKTPSILFKDGKPVLAVGSPGGPTIIASVSQVVLNMLAYDMTLKDAIDEARIYNGEYPLQIWEGGIPLETREKLKEKDHEWDEEPRGLGIGNVQGIWIDHKHGLFHGACDMTRQGMPMG